MAVRCLLYYITDRTQFPGDESQRRRALLAKQQLEEAEATLKTKKAGYETAVQGARNARADIDAEHANLQLAERELRDATIRAPFDAYIQQRLVSPGEFVKSQAAVMTLVKVDPLRLTAEIPERMAPWIKVGVRGAAPRLRCARGRWSAGSPSAPRRTSPSRRST